MKIKTNLILLLFILFLASCKKEAITTNCAEMAQHNSWTNENFKTQYTIQFPENYEGTGMVGFEGNFFNKNRTDDKVKFSYNYCGPLYCEDFGNPLEDYTASSIITSDQDGNTITLENRREFCVNGTTKGIFYYNTTDNATGKYFIEQDSLVFLEGLTVYFEHSSYQEVEDIIKTISFSASNSTCGESTIIDNNLFNDVTPQMIDSMYINDDCLTIQFSASGCDGNSWNLELVALDSIIIPPTLPAITQVQRQLKLSLENNEECEAYITKEISFDISHLKADEAEVGVHQMTLYFPGFEMIDCNCQTSIYYEY